MINKFVYFVYLSIVNRKKRQDVKIVLKNIIIILDKCVSLDNSKLSIWLKCFILNHIIDLKAGHYNKIFTILFHILKRPYRIILILYVKALLIRSVIRFFCKKMF